MGKGEMPSPSLPLKPVAGGPADFEVMRARLAPLLGSPVELALVVKADDLAWGTGEQES